MKISVVIPVYKNKDLFLRNLKTNYQFIKDYEIIIIDDASLESTKEIIKSAYPDITVATNEKNLGFAPSVNRGVSMAHGDIVILLNTDVVLNKDFNSLTHYFQDDDNLFAISFSQIEKDGSVTGKNTLFFRRGFVEHSRAQNMKTGLNAWAEGGASAVRKTHLDRLGGFREIYAPFYWEDIDLSYRAYSAGWFVLFLQEYQVKHYHESTIRRYFDQGYIKTIAYRNQLFFIWSNITHTPMLFKHIVALPFQILRTIMMGDVHFLLACLRAIMMLPVVIKARKHNSSTRRVTDLDIFATLENSLKK